MNTGYLLASLKYFAMGFVKKKKKKSKVYCFLFGAILTLLILSEGITEIYSVCTFYQVNAFMIVRMLLC